MVYNLVNGKVETTIKRLESKEHLEDMKKIWERTKANAEAELLIVNEKLLLFK